MKPAFVLVHSLLLGPSTWLPVADRLTGAGYQACVPSLLKVGEGAPPYWPRAVDAVRAEVGLLPAAVPIVLVAHSNAGLLLPAIRAGLTHRVVGSVFVDAALPARRGSTRAASAEMLEFLRPKSADGLLPRWTDWWDEADVAPLFPNEEIRRTVVAEQPRLPLAYYEQEVPVPSGWNDHPCSYLLFSPSYEELAAEAHDRGWQVAHMPGAHLHQIVDPEGTARHLVELAAGS
ncbi:alpha/beta hydrolase [Actinospica sp. MGRD01-02]|uniref:Alpha/beta hydrolase n=1 Tax=Actinospica acidithermotolerans TaxID=2828514 RepID=A0A941EC11_9ACTN|nr:alpha/beta fold hydrolase [Actinospica acidithermotolerans]MBR7827677.1 alpha/beta hydrolase [Actinospica acidithermotolerans]